MGFFKFHYQVEATTEKTTRPIKSRCSTSGQNLNPAWAVRTVRRTHSIIPTCLPAGQHTIIHYVHYYPLEVSSMKHRCLGVFRKVYFRIGTN